MDTMDQNAAKRADRPVLPGPGRGLLPRPAEPAPAPGPRD
ncbi:hypothetical protein BJY16_000238 [Actinoplanes octamycinicus]|uniref:Uncharacterized protein n=1 Tax=Actinoplanes octamycinicus TaxID=135948 RepID=A0A7W7GR49_9ACTN|nr:hypothetical protein [Actinoplanes octamycinicus]